MNNRMFEKDGTLPISALSARKEDLDQPLYDFVKVPEREQLAVFFSQPVGVDIGMGIRKTQADTNMFHANRLPRFCEFEIQGLAIALPREVETAEITLVIGSKTYLTLPAELCRAEFPGSRGYLLQLSLRIVSETNFMVQAKFAPLKDEARIGAVLFGVFRRPIE